MDRTGRFHKWFSMVHGWKTNGCNVWKEAVQMSVKLIFTIWIESVVSAPLGAEMNGVIGDKKESRSEVM